MRRQGLFAIALIGLLGTFTTTATAAEPELQAELVGACGAQLRGLQDQQRALEDLQHAQAEGETKRRTLRGEAFEIAVQVEILRAEGAPSDALRRLQAAQADRLQEVAVSERIAPVLAAQIDALAPDVDAASRRYILCVEASLAQ